MFELGTKVGDECFRRLSGAPRTMKDQIEVRAGEAVHYLHKPLDVLFRYRD
jgi:hypothetical protein